MADALFCFVSDVATALTCSSSVRELWICISSLPVGELVLKPVPISGHQSKTQHPTSQFRPVQRYPKLCNKRPQPKTNAEWGKQKWDYPLVRSTGKAWLWDFLRPSMADDSIKINSSKFDDLFCSIFYSSIIPVLHRVIFLSWNRNFPLGSNNTHDRQKCKGTMTATLHLQSLMVAQTVVSAVLLH